MENNSMSTSLLSKSPFLNAFMLKVGKDVDVAIQVMIAFGMHLAVANGPPFLWFGALVSLIFYFFKSEHESSKARSYAVATLSTFGYIFWDTLSLVPSDYKLSCLSACVVFCLFCVFVYSDHNLELRTSKFLSSYGKLVCALCQFIIFGFEIYKIHPRRFCLADFHKIFCHSIIVALYGNYSITQRLCGVLVKKRLYGVIALTLIGYYWITFYVLPLTYQLSLLLRIIGSLDRVVCSLGKIAKSLSGPAKFPLACLVASLIKLCKILRERRGLIGFLKDLGCPGVFICLFYYGILALEDPIIEARLNGVASLIGLGQIFWEVPSAKRALWFRVSYVCFTVLLIAGLANYIVISIEPYKVVLPFHKNSTSCDGF